jgi:hypothetical protein
MFHLFVSVLAGLVGILTTNFRRLFLSRDITPSGN